MYKKSIQFFKPGVFPFSLVFFFLLFILIYRLFDLPDPTEIARISSSLYEKYGLWVLLISSFAEGLFMISLYFPGSFVIVFAVIVFGNNSVQLLFVALISIVGFTLANIINYYLGKYSYYSFLLKLGRQDIVEKMQIRFQKSSMRTILFTAFHPNFLAIACICAGIANYNLGKLILQSIFALSLWVSLWTSIVAIFISKINIEDPNSAVYFLILLICWGLGLCIFDYYKKRKNIDRLYK